MEALVHHLSAYLIQDSAGIFTGLRKRIVKRTITPLLERKLYRPIGKGREESIYLVNQVIAQTPTGYGIKVKAHKNSILDLSGWTRIFLFEQHGEIATLVVYGTT